MVVSSVTTLHHCAVILIYHGKTLLLLLNDCWWRNEKTGISCFNNVNADRHWNYNTKYSKRGLVGYTLFIPFL